MHKNMNCGGIFHGAARGSQPMDQQRASGNSANKIYGEDCRRTMETRRKSAWESTGPRTMMVMLVVVVIMLLLQLLMVVVVVDCGGGGDDDDGDDDDMRYPPTCSPTHKLIL